MPTTIPKSLKPRKTPVQERSGLTVDAIFEATIQVLLKEGARNLTTTRVAERAGVSVGTLYQYYPNKEALLVAMLEKHLDLIGQAAQLACRKSHGRPIKEMMSNIIDAFVDAKLNKKDISRAVSELMNEVSCIPRYLEVVKQLEIDVSSMLNTLPGVRTEKKAFITSMMLSTMGGATKMVMDKNAPPYMVKELKQSLQSMLESLVATELCNSDPML